MGQTYSCVRIKKIRTATDAQNATRHGRRERGSFGKSAVDLERTPLNCHWSFDPDTQELERVGEGIDVGAALETRREQMKARRPKNGTFGTEMMFTASPALFHGPDGKVDNDQAKAWAKACLDLAQEKYPGMCVGARLDLDETTPHLSVFIMPVYEKTYGGEKRKSKRAPRRAVSHNKVFGGPDDLRLMQDWAADGLKARGFDVSRGRPVEITRAANFRPDGAIYEKLGQVWRRLRAREQKLDQRERVISGWMKEVGKALLPLRENLPRNLLPGLDHIAKTLDEKSIRPTPGPDEQLTPGRGSSGRRPQEPDDYQAPAPRPPGM